jgi:hypothetical protein
MFSKIKKYFPDFAKAFFYYYSNFPQIQRHQLLQNFKEKVVSKYPHSLLQYGFSVYSQNDEDGIINKICDILQLQNITLIEFGVHPAENNSNFLLLNRKAKGVWVDKGLKKWKSRKKKVHLEILDEFVTIDNISSLVDKALVTLQVSGSQLDLLSLDLDGNDYYFIDELLRNGIRPKLFTLEYNGMFPPPLKVKIDYNKNHKWETDDYYGCSLQQWVDLMLKYDYYLVCCNATGSNAFFIEQKYVSRFHLYTTEELYVPAQHFLSPMYGGHSRTSKYIFY